MYRNARSTVLVLVATTALSFVSQAQLTKEQGEANRARWQSHIVAVRGDLTPSAIPYGEKMAMVFKVLEGRQARIGPEAFRSDLQERYAGSSADREKLSQAIIQNNAFVESVSQQERRALEALCTQLAEDNTTLTAPQIAQRFRAVETQRLNALESHYTAVMQSLGPPIRASMQSEIETRIVPTMTWGTIDHVGLANTFPGPYFRFIKANCARWSASQKN